MTLDEFIQGEIDCNHIQDPDYFYTGLCEFKLDNGEDLSMDEYENYLDYELKEATIHIGFNEMAGRMVWYEIELVSEKDNEEEWHRQVMEEMTIQQLMEQEPELFEV